MGDTVRPAVAVEAWTSLVLGGLGTVGLALLAVAPLLEAPEAFPALPLYAFTLGGVLVVAAATMRLRALLIVFGLLALAAGFAATLAGRGDPALNRSALALACAAAVALGAAARRPWAAVPFLLAPLLIVAPGPGGWEASRDAFARAWVAALGGDHLWAGLPAALAIAGGFVGGMRDRPWVPVRPSAVPLLLLCGGLVLAGLILATVLHGPFAFARTVCLRAALIAGVLGWVALAYQAGRVALAWQSALACLLTLAGAMFVDAGTDYLASMDAEFLVTFLAALLPAALAGVGLLVRKWIGTERPAVAHEALAEPRPVEQKSFFSAAAQPEPVLPTPLAQTGFHQSAPAPKKATESTESAETVGAAEDTPAEPEADAADAPDGEPADEPEADEQPKPGPKEP